MSDDNEGCGCILFGIVFICLISTCNNVGYLESEIRQNKQAIEKLKQESNDENDKRPPLTDRSDPTAVEED